MKVDGLSKTASKAEMAADSPLIYQTRGRDGIRFAGKFYAFLLLQVERPSRKGSIRLIFDKRMP